MRGTSNYFLYIENQLCVVSHRVGNQQLLIFGAGFMRGTSNYFLYIENQLCVFSIVIIFLCMQRISNQ